MAANLVPMSSILMPAMPAAPSLFSRSRPPCTGSRSSRSTRRSDSQRSYWPRSPGLSSGARAARPPGATPSTSHGPGRSATSARGRGPLLPKTDGRGADPARAPGAALRNKVMAMHRDFAETVARIVAEQVASQVGDRAAGLETRLQQSIEATVAPLQTELQALSRRIAGKPKTP